jgi:mono/diheme cytochrome c family protein
MLHRECRRNTELIKFHLVCAAAFVAASLASSSANGEGSIEAGRAIAQRLCARCHATSGPGPSPVEQAPPFGTFGQNWPVEYLAEAFAEGIVTGHGPVRMPAFVFEPEEIDDLLAYLESVQEKR